MALLVGSMIIGSMVISPTFAQQTTNENYHNGKYVIIAEFENEECTTYCNHETVTLRGQGIDPDDDSLKITWTQVGGEQVELISSNTVATFKAPEVENDRVKVLSFELTVEDPYGEIDKDTIILAFFVPPED